MSAFIISLPIFLIIFSGWLLKKKNIVKEEWVHILNQFAYYVSLPALIIVSLYNVDFLDKSSWDLIFYSLLYIVLFSILIFIILFFTNFSNSKKTAIFLIATVGNTVYMGFPLIELGFGKENLSNGMLIGIIYLVIPILISIFIIKYWHNKKHSIRSQLYFLLKNPLVIAAVFGFLFSFLRAEVAIISVFKNFFSLLADTASPVALFALGIFIHGRFLKENLKLTLFVSLLKTLIFPLFILILIVYFMRINNFELFVFLASMPTAVTTFIIAKKFRIEEDLVGSSILISTIFSFFVIPLIVYLF